MPLRVALVGCGKITERLALPQLRRCPGAEVSALVDIRRSTANAIADTFGIARKHIWTDWRQMLREADVDVVAVNVPNALHAEIAVAALRASKHVIVEKPIATTLADADAMVEAARVHRRWLMVDQTQRFDPVHETAHKILQRGALGRITQVRGRLGHAGPQYWAGTRRTWLTDRSVAGGGALMDVGIHIADLLRWLSGKQVKRICCQAMRAKRMTVEESASALVEFTDGASGSFEASWMTRPYEVSTTFYGERGTLRTTIGSAHPVAVQWCRRHGDPNQQRGRTSYPRVPSSSRRGGAYPYFMACVAKGRRPFISGEEARASLEVILAAYESARTREWVDMPLRAGH